MESLFGRAWKQHQGFDMDQKRIRGKASSVESPLGWMPRYEDLD